MTAERAQAAPACIRDLAGRPRGSAFAVDPAGTLVTSHEAVDGLDRLVVHAPGGRTFLAEAAHITALPEADLALIRTDGLGLTPLVLGAERPRPAGTPVRLPAAGQWLDARILGTGTATYTSTTRFHAVEGVTLLVVPGSVAPRLRLSRPLSGAPVLDAVTGAVLAVLGTALSVPGSGGTGIAVPLRTAELLGAEHPLTAVLRRNGATVPGFGPDLNLAGALQLTATSVAAAVERHRSTRPEPRPEIAEELRAFTRRATPVAALVGEPGTGRSTELAALAARRARGTAPAPTVLLRGADLRADDTGLRDAVGRALAAAARIAHASEDAPGGAGTGDPNPDVVARLARVAGRALLVLLDGPEEMPPGLAGRLRHWAAATTSWLHASGARLALACRPEYWEQAGGMFPHEALYVPDRPAGTPRHFADASRGHPGVSLPPCVRVGDLPSGQAARARARHELPAAALAPADAAHPLTLRMLAEVRAAMPPATGTAESARTVPRPGRHEVFAAHLALACLRIAVRVAAVQRPPARRPSVRRLTARAAGLLHDAARRTLVSAQGTLDATAFGELFPWDGGWAAAVLGEGVLAPAGDGYRFADEEFADWMQGQHVQLDTALAALVRGRCGAEYGGARLPRHRIGPVVQALLRCGRRDGPDRLAGHLHTLLDAALPPCTPPAPVPAQEPETEWWACHLLGETLLRLPDASPWRGVLRALAVRVAQHTAAGRGHGTFGPWFWRRLPLVAADRIDLLRRLLPDGPAAASARSGTAGFPDVLDELLSAHPDTPGPMHTGAGLMAPLDRHRPIGNGEEQALCSAGVAWRTSPRAGGAASSPSAPTTGCTVGTS